MYPKSCCASSYRFRDIQFLFIFYLKKIGQGQEEYFIKKRHHSMSNVKVYKYRPILLLQILQFWRYQHFKNKQFKFATLKNRSSSRSNFLNYTIRWKISKSINVTHTFLRQLLTFQRYKNSTFVTSKKQVKVTECNFRNYTIRWQMSKSTNVIFYMFDFR